MNRYRNMDSKNENLTLNDKVKFDSKGGAILGVLEGPVADFAHSTRNGRLYNEQLWQNVWENDVVKEMFANGGIPGELDHPKDRDDIDSEKIAVIMPEPPVKRGGEYWGKFNILDTPCGRIVYTLAKAGFKLGVSSRGNGDCDEYTGEVDPDTYDFTCFDVVILPSVKDARMNLITESLDGNKTFNTLLKEQLDRSSDEDKQIMNDTINHLQEAVKKQKCCLCGKEFTGYGNNARPVKDGVCCDECNVKVVIPERLKVLKESKDDIPDVKIDEDDLTVNESDVEDKGSDPHQCEGCEEFDSKLKDLLDRFLETQELETEGEEEKNLFVKLFHETFPELDCCAEEHNDIDDEEGPEPEPPAADDIGAEGDAELLEQLQKTLKDNRDLKTQLRSLQAEKAVGNSKVVKLTEELNQFKSIAALAGKKSLSLKNYESENTKLTEQLKNLNKKLFDVTRELKQQKSITESVQADLDNKVEENKNLQKKLDSTSQSSKKLEESYQKASSLATKYKNFAHDIANRYIDSKALALGVSSNEIKNRLNESYTLDDVDEVCEQLQEYSINVSKLPFQVSKPTSMRARLREDRSSDPLKDVDSEYDDSVDDYLLDLAGLRK